MTAITFRQAWEYGGPLMWVLAGLSVIAFAVCVYLFFAHRRGALRDLLEDVRRAQDPAAAPTWQPRPPYPVPPYPEQQLPPQPVPMQDHPVQDAPPEQVQPPQTAESGRRRRSDRWREDWSE